METPAPEALLRTLERRFTSNTSRHEGVSWAAVRARLEGDADALRSIGRMEASARSYYAARGFRGLRRV